MEKKLCLGSLIGSILMTLLFILDLFVGFPFSSASDSPFTWVDIAGAVAGGILIYLAFDAYKEVK